MTKSGFNLAASTRHIAPCRLRTCYTSIAKGVHDRPRAAPATHRRAAPAASPSRRGESFTCSALLRQVAAERGVELWLWSVTLGWRDGLRADAPPIPDTEHPAAAMYYVANLPPQPRLYVTLDLAGHLKDERTLRALREAVHKIDAFGGTLVLIDASEELPPAVEAIATRFEVSFPDDERAGIASSGRRCGG